MDSEKRIVGVIFSKDRALQLDATIQSLKIHCIDSEKINFKILYKVSNEDHNKQYQYLSELYPGFDFIREDNFRNQLLESISNHEYVLFLVDDNIFVKDFLISNMIKALETDGSLIGCSLRLGLNTTYCYTLDCIQRIPEFVKIDGNLIKFEWGTAHCDFGYPLELSSSVYRTKDIFLILKKEKFFNPNTLEDKLFLNRGHFSENRKYLSCPIYSVAFNNPINIVQNIFENRVGNNIQNSSDLLMERFDQGLRIDVEKYSNFTPNACHQEVDLLFKKNEGKHISRIVVNNSFNFLIYGANLSGIIAYNLLIKDGHNVIAFIDRSGRIDDSILNTKFAVYKDKSNVSKDVLDNTHKILIAVGNKETALDIKNDLKNYFLSVEIETIFDSKYFKEYISLLPPDNYKSFNFTSFGEKNEERRINWVKNKLSNIKPGLRILDAGAGEQQFKKFCTHLDYVSQDFAEYEGKGNGEGLQTGAWDTNNLDIICDILSIPEPDDSFDAIMCVEVFEHLPDPIASIKEFSRLLKSGGHLIITAPFCSLTHFAPYHFYSGFNKYFYNNHLSSFGFEILEIQSNGNYFEYLAQEIRRIPFIVENYSENNQLKKDELLALNSMVNILNRLNNTDKNSSTLLNFGYHIYARKI